ncbi:MAG TPA: helix-turn-helix domain-containing protein [Marmoricola sp.]|nr:helix-turn-helix domain-containing protein [Marmoricola sp.]
MQSRLTDHRDLRLTPEVVQALRDALEEVSREAVASIIAEVPGYSRALSGPMGQNIRDAVSLALGVFLDLAARAGGSPRETPLEPALTGAYELGRGEARSGRSMDALLAAYRVGARVSWRGLSARAVGAGQPAGDIARFAEMVFAYIDQLSAASVAGHADELETSGRVRQRLLERLAERLLGGARADVVLAAAERADWPVPETLTAVLLPAAQARGALDLLPGDTIATTESDEGDRAVLLVPDASRPALLRVLAGRRAVAGPAREWLRVRASYERARRARAAGLEGDPVDTETHLVPLVLGADPDALADLRALVLAPLAGMRTSTREKLEETLRAWLLHQGRREGVATSLYVHPQTVRYRMGQLREAFGDRLEDPDQVLALTVALGAPAASSPEGTGTRRRDREQDPGKDSTKERAEESR